MKRAVDLVIRAVLLLAIVYLGGAAILRYVVYPPLPLADIAHGGGPALDGTARTDSLEAVARSHESGFRVIEVDIQRTSDGHFVCGHDWRAFGGVAPDLAAFLAQRGAIRHPPCTAQELIAWFEQHAGPDLYVDVKEDAVEGSSLFAAALGRRVVADAASPEVVCALREAGVERAVFSTYLRPGSWKGLRADLDHPCVAQAESVAIPLGRAFLGHAFIVRAATAFPVSVHTVDDCLSTAVARFFGADAVFTDTAGQC